MCGPSPGRRATTPESRITRTGPYLDHGTLRGRGCPERDEASCLLGDLAEPVEARGAVGTIGLVAPFEFMHSLKDFKWDAVEHLDLRIDGRLQLVVGRDASRKADSTRKAILDHSIGDLLPVGAVAGVLLRSSLSRTAQGFYS